MKPRILLLLSFLSLALCFLLTIPAHSAQPDDAASHQLTVDANGLVEVVWNRATTTPSFIRGDFRQTIAQQQAFADAESAALFWVDRYATLLAIEDPTQELSIKKVETDSLGYTHVQLEQFYQGLPVFNAGVNVHLFGNEHHLTALSNSFVPNIALASVVPTFPLTQAITLAQTALPNGVSVNAPLLTVYVDQRDVAPQAHLTWHVALWDAQKLLDNVYVIDAHDGLLLDVWNRVYDARNREIYDAQNKEEFGGTLVRKEGDGPTGDTDADNAYDYAGNTYDYYLTTFGRDSFDGNADGYRESD